MIQPIAPLNELRVEFRHCKILAVNNNEEIVYGSQMIKK